GFEPGVPVDQPLVAVDQALIVERDEDLGHRADHLIVRLAMFAQGEAFAAPVGRGAEALQLVDDGAATLGLPFPDALDELFAPHVAAVLLPLGKLPLDDHLRGDAAWSVPGCQSTSRPRIRLKRVSTSWIVLL